MLVYTGCRLAAPREFVRTYEVGREQLVVFVPTLIVSLASDLLMGVISGVAVEFLIHWINGVSLSSMFRQPVSVDEHDDRYVVSVKCSVVFTNWITLKGQLVRLNSGKDIVLDLSQTELVDHTVMEALHELEREYAHEGRKLTLVGLDKHMAFSDHPQSARKRTIRPSDLEAQDFSENGARDPLPK